MYTICIQYVYSMYTICIQCAYNMYTICIQYVYIFLGSSKDFACNLMLRCVPCPHPAPTYVACSRMSDVDRPLLVHGASNEG